MPQREGPEVSEKVLSQLDFRRRDFLGQLIAGSAFVTPVMTSLSLGAPRPAQAQGVPEIVVQASADTVLRLEAPHTNEGANPRLRVSVDPVARVVVQFDPSAIEAALPGAVSIHLALDIANNCNNWGQGDDRTVSVLPLFERFTEGNGMQTGLPGAAALRGTGPGATWYTSEDLDVSNGTAESMREPWDGGSRRIGTPEVQALHVNEMIGTVEWDVTTPVRNGISAFLVKVTDEDGPGVPPALGEDPGFGGTVEYWSIQAGPAPDGSDRAPRLVFFGPASSG